MTSPTRHVLAGLPPVLKVEQAAEVLDISRTAAYALIRTGEWPTPVFRLGRLIRIPTAPLLKLLGVDPEETTSGPARTGREAG